MPRLQSETQVDVVKCHVCHAKWRWMSLSATPATQNESTSDQRRPSGAKCATGASPVPEVPRLPHKTKVDVVKCHTCHAKLRCHAKCRGVTGDHQRPAAPKRCPSAPPEPAQCHKCHACHTKRRWMWPSATPATRDEGGCHQVPRLPRKVPRRHWRPAVPKRRPSVPPEPAQCRKCHACHAKRHGDQVVCERWQSCRWKMVCDKVVSVKDGVWQRGVWQSCVWKMVCD